jgi:hypothetical protein
MTHFPWLSLVAGDVVNIYPGTYATKVALRAQGTASQPVIINGVTDANCNRPVVTGVNAVTTADAITSGFYGSSGGKLIQGNGLFILFRGAKDPYGYKPMFLAIQNLTIEGASASNTYTSAAGVATHWGTEAAGIYDVESSVFTIQNCVITGNGDGVFVNSQGNASNGSAPTASYYTTLRGNMIYNNGVAGSYLEHNVYVQGVRSLYEGNYIGQLIPNALGGSLKDRSSGPVVRYNTIVAAARAIDLVDAEDGGNATTGDPVYNYGWIYGNLIINGTNGSGDLIHWGGDSTEYNLYHQGPLSVYFNTIVNTIPTAIFDMSMSTQSVNSYSNIISSTRSLSLCTASSPDGKQVGAVNLYSKNWIQSGFVGNGASQYKPTPQCTYSQDGTLIAGSPELSTSDGLLAGSPASGAGSTFPVSAPVAPVSVANLTPTYQPATTASGSPTYVARSTVADVGAFAAP